MNAPALSLTNLTGLVLSLACVVHCILTPVFLASLPSWGLSWLASPYLHQVLAIIGVAIGMATLVPGWRRHRKTSVLVWAAGGLLIMNYAAFAGGDCCAAPADGTNATASCCAAHAPQPKTDSCCTAHAAVAKADSGCCHTGCESTLVAGESESQANEASMIPLFGWLWQHPTAFGAVCLAWAHCLNGGCSRRCCQTESKSEEAVELQASA